MRTPETEAVIYNPGERVQTKYGPGTVTEGEEFVQSHPGQSWSKLVSTGRIILELDNPGTLPVPVAMHKDELTHL